MLPPLLVFLLFTSTAQALGLGAIQSQSALGQPLRLSIPVQSQSDDEVDCVRVSAGDDGLPVPANARASVLHKGAARLLEITTRQSQHEPALSLKLSVGCDTTVTRQYVVLLDPPQMTDLAEAAAVTEASSTASPSASSIRGGTTAAAGSSAAAPVRKKLARKPVRAALPQAVRPKVETAAEPAALKAAGKSQQTARPVARPTEPQADHLVLSTQVAGKSAPMAAPASASTPPAFSAASATPVAPTVTPEGAEAANEAVQVAAQMAAREADLNARIQRLTTQAAELQKQIDALSVRNRTLEQTRQPDYVVWVFGVIALLALVLASWYVWRYRMLRQSVEGQPWWTGHTEAPPTMGPTVMNGMSPAQQTAAPRQSASAPRMPAQPRAPAPASRTVPGQTAPNSVRARLDQQALTPLANTTATDIGGLSHAAHAMEVSEDEAFDATQSSFERLANSYSGVSKTAAPPAAATATNGMTPAPTKPSASIDLDITTSGLEKPIRNQVDFSLATDIAAPASEPSPAPALSASPSASPSPRPPASSSSGPSIQSATESFFMGINTEPQSPAPTSASAPALASTPARLNPHFLQDEGDLSAIRTEPMRHDSTDLASQHMRLVQYTGTLEQIEELIRRDDSAHAIEILRGHVLNEHNMPTLMWLLLLDQYRKTGKKSVFESLAQHFSRRYNRAAPRWEQSWAERAPQVSLGQMPGVDDSLKVLWGTHKGLEQIEQLICGTNQPDTIVFNTVLQRELLQLAPMYPLDKLSKI